MLLALVGVEGGVAEKDPVADDADDDGRKIAFRGAAKAAAGKHHGGGAGHDWMMCS